MTSSDSSNNIVANFMYNITGPNTQIQNPDIYVLSSNLQGMNEVKYSDGETYFGQLKNYKRDGYGVCTYVNGEVYDGRWKDGKKYGKGTSKCANSTIYCVGLKQTEDEYDEEKDEVEKYKNLYEQEKGKTSKYKAKVSKYKERLKQTEDEYDEEKDEVEKYKNLYEQEKGKTSKYKAKVEKYKERLKQTEDEYDEENSRLLTIKHRSSLSRHRLTCKGDVGRDRGRPVMKQQDRKPNPTILPPQITDKEDTPNINEKRKKPKLIIDKYSDKSFVVSGDTKQYKNELKTLMGKWNPNLKCGAGWIFSNSNHKNVQEYVEVINKTT